MTDTTNLLSMLDDIESAIEAESDGWAASEPAPGVSESPTSAEPLTAEGEAAIASQDVLTLQPTLPDFEAVRRERREPPTKSTGVPRSPFRTRDYLRAVAWEG